MGKPLTMCACASMCFEVNTRHNLPQPFTTFYTTKMLPHANTIHLSGTIQALLCTLLLSLVHISLTSKFFLFPGPFSKSANIDLIYQKYSFGILNRLWDLLGPQWIWSYFYQSCDIPIPEWKACFLGLKITHNLFSVFNRPPSRLSCEGLKLLHAIINSLIAL